MTKRSAGAALDKPRKTQSPLQVVGAADAYCAMMRGTNRTSTAITLSGGVLPTLSFMASPDLGRTDYHECAEMLRRIKLCLRAAFIGWSIDNRVLVAHL